MNNTNDGDYDLQKSFIAEWIKRKKSEGTLNQDIISAIDSCLIGAGNDELDEKKLLQSLKEIVFGGGE